MKEKTMVKNLLINPLAVIGICLAGAGLVFLSHSKGGCAMAKSPHEQIEPAPIVLPQPKLDGDLSLEQTLLLRRSVRRFDDASLTLAQASQLLWAAQGITHSTGFRAPPSAGALFPLEILLAADRVEGIKPGIYRYIPQKHQVIAVKSGSYLDRLAAAGLGQGAIRQASAAIIISGVFARTTGKYGKRGIQYVFIEAGHAGQNILLQAVACGLAAVPIGAFDDGAVTRLMGLPPDETPLYIIPVGRPADGALR